MWLEVEEYEYKRLNTIVKTKSDTTDTVIEESTADVCVVKIKLTVDSFDHSDKFNQILGIVQNQSEQDRKFKVTVN